MVNMDELTSLVIEYCHAEKVPPILSRWLNSILRAECWDLPLPPGLSGMLFQTCCLRYLPEKRIISIVSGRGKKLKEHCVVLDRYLVKHLGTSEKHTISKALRVDHTVDEIAKSIAEDIVMKCAVIGWRP